MTDWIKFEAILSELADPYNFNVYVYGVTETTAMDKLIGEYPVKKYKIVSFGLALEQPYMSGHQVQIRFNPE